MKNFLHTVLIMLPMVLLAQVPQGISYQAVAYDNNGFEMANQELTLQISLLDLTADGSASYTETHILTTNDFGLFALEIGAGTTQGDFAMVNWKSKKFLKVEMQTETGMQTLGVSQFMSVPYAHYAKRSADTDQVKTLLYLSSGF
jgi:hypothetical protein